MTKPYNNGLERVGAGFRCFVALLGHCIVLR